MNDEYYMELALSLAAKGAGQVNPNPLVGAVIVKDGRIIGSGWHRYFGGLHAERNALADCSESPEGACMYVTLEPCCHYGKTPPCTDAIMENKISRVVIGTLDPHDKVAGKGAEILRRAGIQVEIGVLEDKCRAINQVFFHYITHKTPYVVMKYGMTMDGKTATCTGMSRWITCEESRKKVHEDRNLYSGIMAGIGTVLKDDPLLTCRLPGGRNPVRIICDSHLRLPLNSRIAETAAEAPVILATTTDDPQALKPYRDKGIDIIITPEKEGHIDLRDLMLQLGRKQIDGILLEGGGTLNDSALRSGIVQKIQCYIAPKVLGGKEAHTPVEGRGFSALSEAVQLQNTHITPIGCDYLLESEVISSCSPES